VSTEFGDAVETAEGRAAGDQFEFTVKHPVSLARRQSAMLPLVGGAVPANKMLVFSAAGGAAYGKPSKPKNPAIGAEIINDTGMKLPAGAITVYDGGTYAGDALIEFFPEGEKRIISYGEELSVTGWYSDTKGRAVRTAAVKSGEMVIKGQSSRKRAYTFRNASGETKRLVVEHPILSAGAALAEPSGYMEKTSALYRFELTLPPGETRFEVTEEKPVSMSLTLSNCSERAFLRYISDKEIPEAVRSGLRRAVELQQKADAYGEELSDLEEKYEHLLKEQERTRKNLSAAGNQTQQGQQYLARLAGQDKEIDAITAQAEQAEQAEKAARQEYDDYLREMYIKE
jgi:hypothetical protein